MSRPTAKTYERTAFLVLLVLSAGMMTACAGTGVNDAERQSREAQTKAAEQSTTGFSVWSMFGSSERAVRKRLDPGLGKTKSDLITSFGQPFQCNPAQPAGEICGWYDRRMSEGIATEASAHRVFYTFDSSGIARDWHYQGVYGKHSSSDVVLQPPPASPAPLEEKSTRDPKTAGPEDIPSPPATR
jgi:hypothetical protein